MDNEHKGEGLEIEKPEEQDFDYYIVKLDRYDKEGNDISGDVPSSGGRRRGGSKLSTQYYDPQPYNPDESKEPAQPDSPKPTPDKAVEKAEVPKKPKTTNSTPTQQRVPANTQPRARVPANAAVPRTRSRVVIQESQVRDRNYYRRKRIGDALIDTGLEVASDIWNDYKENVLYPKFLRWRNEKMIPGVRRFFGLESPKSKPEQRIERAHVPEAPMPTVTNAHSNTMVTALQSAVNEYSRDMSDEEKQRHLLKMYLHYIGFVREWKAMEGVPISEQDIAEVKKMLYSPRMTAAVNTMLMNNTALLEDGDGKTLSGLLETTFVHDGEFVPIQPKQVYDLVEEHNG